MKTSPTQFTERGFTHTQLSRQGKHALFQRQGKAASLPHFEVIVVEAHNGYEFDGVKVPPGEMYPNAKQWGAKGWTFTERAQAQQKFESLCGCDVSLDDPAFL